MLRRSLVVTVAFVLTGCGGGALASSTFEANDEGWTLSGNADTSQPELRANGGNPGGNICGADDSELDVLYYVAPSKYLGNKSKAFGLRLTYDLKQNTIFQQGKGRDVVLQGNGLSVVFNVRQTPGLDWTAYSVSIDSSSGWKMDDGTGDDVSEENFRLVLKDVRSLRIRGEFHDGPADSTCLDNVYFGAP